jgi:hypothetical protein
VPGSSSTGLTTVSLSSTNKFLIFDTYETYRAPRYPLMLQQMTGQEMVSIIKEEFITNESETNSIMFALDGTSINTTKSRNV